VEWWGMGMGGDEFSLVFFGFTANPHPHPFTPLTSNAYGAPHCILQSALNGSHLMREDLGCRGEQKGPGFKCIRCILPLLSIKRCTETQFTSPWHSLKKSDRYDN
jgi:hypothetical protein